MLTFALFQSGVNRLLEKKNVNSFWQFEWLFYFIAVWQDLVKSLMRKKKHILIA